MAIQVGFYDAKNYDRTVFNTSNDGEDIEIHYFGDRLNEESVRLSKGMDVICIFVDDTCDSRVIEALKANGVRLIALRCAGFNNVDLAAAAAAGIPVVRVPAYSPHAVAEYAVTLMLCLNRKVYRSTNRTREWNFKLDGLMGFDMYGKTVGIVGLGRIARCVAEILHGFGMKILAYDLYPDKAFAEKLGIELVDLDEIYRRSDIITLHVPLTPQTRYMINNVSIDKMKPGVMIINTGRGKLISSSALIEGLRSRKVSCAGLDVYEDEQKYFYEDLSDSMISDDKLSILLTMPNVIVTSHQAFFTKEALENIAHTTLTNIRDFIAGKPLVNEVKP
ncbi:2-hydroxyacid dehydrogenase [Prevotella sp. AGR2160]|uniref:2-hydroxyacid dehydrogenase n=1 Tax=Prevotella sp. AGR2160 TaxID=1280674 RepID=UPI000404CD38|nr:2-hydroxyacid dehydrogenase [Prevotella sp. AGR2160]